MKKFKFLYSMMALAAGLSFTACSNGSDDEEGGSVTPGGPDAPAVVDNGTFTASKLMGVVTSSGFPLKGVTVTNGTLTATTDANGVFSFDQVNVVGGRAVLKFSKEGYVDVVRSRPQVDGDLWNVAMRSTSDWQVATETYSSATTHTLSSGLMQVEMPDGYKDAATGAAYTGNVTAQMVYLSPDDYDFADAMPGGDLAAIRADNSEAQLVSYGMIHVSMTGEGGQKLQLADGKTAKLTFPIPNSLQDKTPEQIPLWTFDEETGLWKEEGMATLQGSVYVGTVSHFSWANLDYPEKRATLQVTVKDTNGKPLPYIPVVLDGQTTYRTNAKGTFECFVPANNAMDAVVLTESYANLSEPVKVAVPSLSGGETKSITITLPATSVVSGKVTNEGTGSRIVSITIFYGDDMGMSTASTCSDLFGNYQIYAPVGYKGEATIVARAADGTRALQTITLDGTDKVVNININSSAVAAGAGQIVITNSKGEKNVINLPEVDSEATWVGVSMKGDILIVHFEAMDTFDRSFDRIQFQIPNYSTEKTAYENVAVQYMHEGSYQWANINVTATVNVVKKGSRYYFTMEDAHGTYDTQGTNDEVTLDAEFNLPEISVAE
ncbi:MAG: hypothetical protein IJV06_11690 [Bacteroidaceae bacterium]|nr:hypothetical protein [Bacteroidaceae bacterium]